MYRLKVVRIQLQLDQIITTSYNKLRYEVIYVGILLRNKNPLYYIQMYDIGGWTLEWKNRPLPRNTLQVALRVIMNMSCPLYKANSFTV